MSRRQRGAHRETEAPGWTLADLAAVNPRRDGEPVDVAENHNANWETNNGGPPWPRLGPGPVMPAGSSSSPATASATRRLPATPTTSTAPQPDGPIPFTETVPPSAVLARALRMLDTGNAIGDLFGQEAPRD